MGDTALFGNGVANPDICIITMYHTEEKIFGALGYDTNTRYIQFLIGYKNSDIPEKHVHYVNKLIGKLGLKPKRNDVYPFNYKDYQNVNV